MELTENVKMFSKCFINIITICFLIFISKPVNCDTCAKVQDSAFKVDELVTCDWYFQSNVINGCVGYNNVKSNCTVTMGFCRKLKQKVPDCQDSSLCVKTMNGAGKKLTVSHSVGQFGPSPFHVSKDGFVASFVNGSKYTKKDNSNCTLTSEVHFLCDRSIHWTAASIDQKAVLPIGALLNNSFDEKTCKYTIFVQYEGACIPILPPLVPDKNLSVGSILIIIFVILVSTYFLCGCTFKFCYGFQGAEILPHSQFWIDLPVLITDGMMFTAKCGKTDASRTYDGI